MASAPPHILARFVRRVDRLLTWKRARTYALVLVALYLVAWVDVIALGSPPLNSSSVPIGGDYIAFHTAARLLVAGRGAELYDHSVVSSIQDALLGGRVPAFYDAYRNPPFYALLYVPFAWLDLLPGFAAFSVLSLACLVLALRLLVDEVPPLRPRWRGLSVLVFAFPPVYFGIIDGENATVSLLLYVLIYRALVHGQDRAAGSWAALGLFKPQLFLVFPLVFLVRRQWRALAAYAATAVLVAVVSLLLVGPQGMQGWLRILVEVESGNAEANAWRMASLKSFLDTLAPGQSSLTLGLYLTSSLVLLTGVVSVWANRHTLLPLAWSFTVLSAVLIDPHLVDYDLTVLIAATPLMLTRLPRAALWIILALYPMVLFRAQISFGTGGLGLTVLALVALAATVWAARPDALGQRTAQASDQRARISA